MLRSNSSNIILSLYHLKNKIKIAIRWHRIIDQFCNNAYITYLISNWQQWFVALVVQISLIQYLIETHFDTPEKFDI